jgi:UDP-N-acetylglucosamine 1-carboxyvinyltransferase
MLAAVLAQGTSVIRNAAREPEIADLAACLAGMGAAIAGAGSDVVTVRGGRVLSGAVHQVMPDRIELGTLACAAAITGGELALVGLTPEGARLDLLGAAFPLLAAAGVALAPSDGGAVIARRAAGGLRGIDIVTQPYPGFATDLQAPAMALLATAAGASTLTETIFEQRFRHVDELRKLGASIAVRGRTAMVRGVATLRGAAVTGSDVRAAAALLIAGLGADGTTTLDGLEHLDRGYDRIVEKLAACGAAVARADA